MKDFKKQEAALIERALTYPEDSPERWELIGQIVRLYCPKPRTVGAESIEQVEF